MSSHPNALRFSPFTMGMQNNNNNSNNNNKNMQQQQQTPVRHQITNMQNASTKQQSYSGSESDVSTSNENLSNEERYVLRHTARVEPQGQENLDGNVTPVNEMQGRYIPDNQMRFSSNISSDSTRFATPSSNRSMSEVRNPPMYVNQQGNVYTNSNNDSNRSSIIVTNNNSNRNSLKEANSNRSSMDVSQSSYNTLIIHNDDGIYSVNREYSPPPYMISKKERPRSYGEQQGMQELTEIPEEYLNQSHVLKHLAKEVKIPNTNNNSTTTTTTSNIHHHHNHHNNHSNINSNNIRNRSDSNTRDSGVSENTDSRDPPKYGSNWTSSDEHNQAPSIQLMNKLKSKSQPDLTRSTDIDLEDVENLVKENSLLKQQLNSCYLKVAKSQKLEQEVANIYRVHEELVQSCERREKLERTARTRLQSDCRRLQELNRALKDQVEVLQNQLLAPSDHQLGRTQQDVLISQLVTQNKDLADANKRQYIEIQAQSATLEEQRIHINVLDTALKRLEEECRQKQIYVERCGQLQHALQSLQNASERREQVERKLRLDFQNEISKDANRSGSSTISETNNLKWQLREKDNQIMRLENECAKLEQRNLEESNVRNATKIAIERNSQETERIIAEAKQEKIRYLDEAHAANRKVTELQTRLKVVENRLTEKEAMIRALQGQKIYGSNNSYGSYNLSSDSFAINPLSYNSQTSYDTTSTSLLDPNFGPNNSTNFTSNISQSSVLNSTGVGNYSSNNFDQSNASYNQGAINLQTSNYSPSSSSYSTNYCPTSSYANHQNSSNLEAIYDSQTFDAQRKSIDDQLKQLDEQLLSKRGLCCFPGLTSKKPIQTLLSDEVSVLSANNSDTFLQNLVHIDQRERDRERDRERERDRLDHRDPDSIGHATKSEEIVFLEKQGRCSQKIRNNTLGNLAQISHAIGMTDISNIGHNSLSSTAMGNNTLSTTATMLQQSGIPPPRKERGTSMPPSPSQLPRPPRSLKPPRKIEYGRLSDSEIKKRSQTPPKTMMGQQQPAPPSPQLMTQKQQQQQQLQNDYEMKTSSLKRTGFGKREFSPAKNFIEMKENLRDFTMKHKSYGAMNKTENENKFGFKSNSPGEFLKPDFISSTKKYYHRLEEPTRMKKSSPESNLTSMKRSLLPSARKMNTGSPPSTAATTASATTQTTICINSNNGNSNSLMGKDLRDSSSGSNNSNTSNTISRYSPIQTTANSQSGDAGGNLSSYHHLHHMNHHQQQQQQRTRTPPKYIPLQTSSEMKSNTIAKSAGNKMQMLTPNKSSSSLPSSSILHANAIANSSAPMSSTTITTTASLPPKPMDSSKNQRRGSSLTRGENKYRIQF